LFKSILKTVLQDEGVLPERSFENWQQLEEALKNVPLLRIDATERPTQRPQNEQQQKGQCSGKKQHTLKNTLIATTLGWIVFLGKTAAGSTHDFTLLKEEFDKDWLEEYFLWVDLGYQGIDKYYAHKGLIQAVKKKKGQKLNH
jgi:hypothetical protein